MYYDYPEENGLLLPTNVLFLSLYPYFDRMVKRFGLLSYGCCERVDNIGEDYLSGWDNLRKLSVSTSDNGEQVGEYLRGERYVQLAKETISEYWQP